MTTKEQLLKLHKPQWRVKLDVDGDVGFIDVPQYLNISRCEVAVLYAFSLMEQAYPTAVIRFLLVEEYKV